MPLLETKGAASAQGFGGAGAGSSGPVNYIEDVFSTYLYTGNGTSQTITNGIDLTGKGGLVWIKERSVARDHYLFDTVRGVYKALQSNTAAAELTVTGSGLSAFTSSGFTLTDSIGRVNESGQTYVSWTFRKQPKFFDVVTYTGNGSNRTISHNLDSVPGCIIVKRTDTTADWQVYHRSLANTEYMVLNDTAAKATGATRWNSTTPTSTVFSLGTDTTVNASGGTYVAYLFAHNAGGFGAAGTDNVISCGTYNGNSTTNSINLGYEPQWLLIKRTTVAVSDWVLLDNMRGLTVGTSDAALCPNNANAEGATVSVSNAIRPTATGFDLLNANSALNVSGSSYIYIAIRRGPMKVPTSGTSVFSPNTSTTYNDTNTTGFPVDAQIWAVRGGVVRNSLVVDRLRGVGTGGSTNDGPFLSTALSDAEIGSGNNTSRSWNNTGFNTPGYAGSVPEVFWSFRRAPSFFDEVCYTGTGSATTQAHNLGVAPELLIVKSRNTGATRWCVGSSALGGWGSVLFLNTNAAVDIFSGIQFNSTAPTSTVFTVGSGGETNVSAYTYVAYLFASCPGVSKVGSYTGTGALQTVNCGFTGGARFVLIKRTDSTGDWYVYDSARGISSGNDPYLLLNSTAAEVTGTNYVDTDSTGFKVTAAAPAGLNANGGSFVFLAIA